MNITNGLILFLYQNCIISKQLGMYLYSTHIKNMLLYFAHSFLYLLKIFFNVEYSTIQFMYYNKYKTQQNTNYLCSV